MIDLPKQEIFDHYDPEHFFTNVAQYRAKPEGLATDRDFMYVLKAKRGSASILTPRCLKTGQRYVLALWS